MKHASVDRAKRICTSCRNHGSCPWCRRSRTMSQTRIAALIEAEVGAMRRGFRDSTERPA